MSNQGRWVGLFARTGGLNACLGDQEVANTLLRTGSTAAVAATSEDREVGDRAAADGRGVGGCAGQREVYYCLKLWEQNCACCEGNLDEQEED